LAPFILTAADTARKFILRFRSVLEQIAEDRWTPIPGRSSGIAAKYFTAQSGYELITQSGPEHEKTFVVQAIWEGIVLGQGSGQSKKQAETSAALEAMKLKRWRTLG
jgi:ribonuclease-3